MSDRLGSLIEELKSVVGGLEPDELRGDEAMDLCSRFAEVERLGAAGRIVTGARVVATEVWRRGGCRSAADWVARHAGTDPERAGEGLETAARLGECPAVAAGLRAGRLSDAQASVPWGRPGGASTWRRRRTSPACRSSSFVSPTPAPDP
jgi:hypothetical protein